MGFPEASNSTQRRCRLPPRGARGVFGQPARSASLSRLELLVHWESSTRSSTPLPPTPSPTSPLPMLTRNHENTLENHENQPKNMKNHNNEEYPRRWSSPNNCISSDGNVCPKHIGIALLWKKTITIASSQKFDHSSSLVVAGEVVQKIQETAVGSGVATVALRHCDWRGTPEVLQRRTTSWKWKRFLGIDR